MACSDMYFRKTDPTEIWKTEKAGEIDKFRLPASQVRKN